MLHPSGERAEAEPIPQVFVFSNSSDLLVKQVSGREESSPSTCTIGTSGSACFVFPKTRQFTSFVIPMLDHFGLSYFFQEEKDGGYDSHKNSHLEGK